MALGALDLSASAAPSGGGVRGYLTASDPPGASRRQVGYRGALAYRGSGGWMQADRWPWERLIARKLQRTVAAVCAVIRGSAPHPEPREAREGTEAP